MEIKIQIFHLQPKLKHLGINLTKDVQESALKIQNIATIVYFIARLR